jgi:hypothetical protein
MHRWKIIGMGNITYLGNVTGHYYHLQCEKCGDVRLKELA